MSALDAAFARLPLGAFEARHDGRLWHAVRTDHANGKSQKLVAREAGGRGYVSVNIYRLSDGRVLWKPCEMPLSTVAGFVLGAEVAGAP